MAWLRNWRGRFVEVSDAYRQALEEAADAIERSDDRK